MLTALMLLLTQAAVASDSPMRKPLAGAWAARTASSVSSMSPVTTICIRKHSSALSIFRRTLRAHYVALQGETPVWGCSEVDATEVDGGRTAGWGPMVDANRVRVIAAEATCALPDKPLDPASRISGEPFGFYGDLR